MEAEKKLAAKEEELKANEVELVDKAEKLENSLGESSPSSVRRSGH